MPAPGARDEPGTEGVSYAELDVGVGLGGGVGWGDNSYAGYSRCKGSQGGEGGFEEHVRSSSNLAMEIYNALLLLRVASRSWYLLHAAPQGVHRYLCSSSTNILRGIQVDNSSHSHFVLSK